jgi:hypothetical protein
MSVAKRPRSVDSAAVHIPEGTTASLRGSLLRRIDESPSFWGDISARFGTTGADAGLCGLGREVAGALRTVGELAEAERQRLEALRATLHVMIDTSTTCWQTSLLPSPPRSLPSSANSSG